MKRFLLPALAWFAFSGGADPTGRATVEVSMAPDGLRAVVALDRPTTRFAFSPADVVRAGDFELLTPGLKLSDDRVTAAAPFRRFELLIRPIGQERDAKYPAHFRIGLGGVLYAPALAGDPAAWRTRFEFRTAPGETRLPATGDVDGGFVFLGPAALVTETSDLIAVTDPATPSWLVERTRTDLAAAVRFYAGEIGLKLPRKPLLILKHDDQARGPMIVGDVSAGAVTALRFHGPAWTRPDPAVAKSVQSFVLHEAFHFWNGGLTVSALGTPTWLHEGGAEYAALMGGLSSGVLDEADVRGRLADALGRCRSGLEHQGDKALADLPFLSNQVRYPCGLLLQWSFDLQLRRASAGGRGVLDAWGYTIRTAFRRSGRQYGLSDFRRAAGLPGAGAVGPAALLIERSGPARWNELAPALNELGAEVEQVATPETRRQALVFHLLGQNCRALPKGVEFGFYADNGRVKLDSPAGCGVLAGDPSLRSVEGGDPFAMTEATYETVRRRCAAGESVALTAADGRTLPARCAEPLGPAPPGYIVRRWRPARSPA